MNVVHDNPLSLLQLKPTRPRKSTPAQRAAARANGSKSQGPKTIEGKQRSSANSLRHGLLAKKFMPPDAALDDQALFRRIRAELIEEFHPQKFLEWFTVDGLSADLVQLGRARQMAEVLQQPAAMAPEDRKKWQAAREGRRDLKTIRRLSVALDGKETLSCAPSCAARLARRIALYAQSVREFVFPVEEVSPPEDDFERRELETQQGQWQLIAPFERKIMDQERMARVLTGTVRSSPRERKILRSLFGFIVRDLNGFIVSQLKLEEQVEQAKHQKLLAMAQAPDNLLLLRRYTAQLEATVRKKLRALARG